MKKDSFILKHENFLIAIISGIVGLISLYFYYSHGLTLQYNDATSHLNIARRVTDSLTPGLVQIGSNWLPLLHILEIPFAKNYFLWQSGLAGGIISLACFIFSSVFIYKSIKYATKSTFGAYLGLFVFLTNANILYMSTTAMFEPLLIATFTGSVYFLIRWLNEQKITLLIGAAFMVFFSTITRYDGWFTFIAASILIFTSTAIKKGCKQAEGSLLIFASLAGLGIILWLGYNQIIFGQATYFTTSEFSAASQQKIWESVGMLPTKGNILLSTAVYLLAVLYNNGLITTILSLFGFFYLLFSKKAVNTKLILFVLISPLIFHIVSLFIGNSILWLPNLPPYDPSFFNVRYGLVLASSIAIVIGILGSNKKTFLRIFLITLVLIQGILFYSSKDFKTFSENNIVTLQDTKAGINISDQKTSKWIIKNCSTGLTLISSGAFESVIFDTGFELNKFITEGTGKYWKKSLINPRQYASCVVMSNSLTDRLRIKLQKNENFERDFQLSQVYGAMEMYERKNNK